MRSAAERRIARDGQPYTWHQFLNFFGFKEALTEWQRAPPFGAATEHPPTAAGQGDAASSAAQPPLLQAAVGTHAPLVSVVAGPTGEAQGVSSAIQPAAQGDAASSAAQPPVLQAAVETHAPLMSVVAGPTEEPQGVSAATEHAAEPAVGFPAVAWNPREWDVFQTHLPRSTEQLTPREAINRAYNLYEHLPLFVEHITPSQALLEQCINKGYLTLNHEDVLCVTAERIPRVTDTNRKGCNRVDFFVYLKNESVLRFHPGRTTNTWAKPHMMLPNTRLFSRERACLTGVGNALHMTPPGLVQNIDGADQPVVLCSIDDLDSIADYDANMHGWPRMVAALTHVDRSMHADFDYSNGAEIPWWLWLANTGNTRTFAQHGVTSFKVVVRNQQALLQIETLRNTWMVALPAKESKSNKSKFSYWEL